jgi:hypothetical protein
MSNATPPFYGPMKLGQLLDRTFRLLRANLRLFVGIATVPLAAFFLTFFLAFAVFFFPILSELPKQPDPNALSGTLLHLMPFILVILFLQAAIFALYLAAACHAAVKADFGIRVTFREAYELAMKQAGRYVLLLVLIYAIAFFPALLIDGMMFAVSGLFGTHHPTPSPFMFILLPLGALLYFAALVYGVIATIWLSLAFPACVSEGLTATAAIKRSGQLTRSAKGRIFLVVLVVYAGTYLILLIVMSILIFLFAMGYVAGSAVHLHLPQSLILSGIACGGILIFGGMVCWMAVTWAGFSTALAVLYNDQRMRIDGPVASSSPGGVPA